jgi:hypothetical protein
VVFPLVSNPNHRDSEASHASPKEAIVNYVIRKARSSHSTLNRVGALVSPHPFLQVTLDSPSQAVDTCRMWPKVVANLAKGGQRWAKRFSAQPVTNAPKRFFFGFLCE